MLKPRAAKTVHHRKIKVILLHAFGLKPKDMMPYIKAFYHKSYNSKTRSELNNERLEFLGDAFLSAFCAAFLFNKLPKKKEGDLTKLKSKIVSRSFLNHLAGELYINQAIKHKLEQNIEDSSLPGNALEALIGAIYIDQGYKAVEKALDYLFTNFIDLEQVKIQQRDFKSLLWEFAQKEKIGLESEVLEEKQSANRKVYKIQIFTDIGMCSTAEGRSKKKAEQLAAMQLLKEFGQF